MNSKKSGRRQFLKRGAALALLSQGAGGLVGMAVGGGLQRASGQQTPPPGVIRVTGLRPRGELSRFEKSARTGTAGLGFAPLQDLYGIITPTELHFYQNHEMGYLMDIDPQQYRLMIHGMVDRPLVLTLAELKRLPSVSRICFVECNSNGSPRRLKSGKTVQDTHGLISCAEWTGAPLSLLLKEAGVQRGANWLVAGSEDTSNHASSVAKEKAMDDTVVAYAMNGEPLLIEHGYPVRLILPGYGGRIHVKWLNRIKAVDQPYMITQDRTSYMEHTPAGEGAFLLAGAKARQWHFSVYVKSVITSPSGGQRLPGRGFYEISGLAWSGGGAIRRVEVSADGGKTWNDAQLQEPVLRHAFTRFRFPWNWNGEETVLQSRSTDENGDVQPSPTELDKNWGADPSEACTSVMGEDCNRIPRRAHRAYIQSWRVTPDGSVHNDSADIPNDDVIEGGHIHH